MKISYILSVFFILLSHAASGENRLQRVQYNNPGLVVGLGVGLSLWPVPMAADGRRISRGYYNVTPSYVDGRVIVVVRNLEFPDYAVTGLETPVASGKFLANVHTRRLRTNQWRYVDYDGDGDLDLTIGIEDWGGYGWDNKGPFKLGFNNKGEWVNGPILGQIYILINYGTTEKPQYGPSVKLKAGGEVINGYGMPSQNSNDFDGDGDLDLMTGEILGNFTYYQNVGTRTEPEYATGLRLPFVMDLETIVIVALDWDKDGGVDLVVGQEDGRVALIEHTGKVGKETGLPQFIPPRFFKQQAGAVMFGNLVTPVGVDWDGDGRIDLLADDLKTNARFFRNMSQNDKQVALKDMGPMGTRILARHTTSPTTVDWDGDGIPELLVGAEDGRLYHMKNPNRVSPGRKYKGASYAK